MLRRLGHSLVRAFAERLVPAAPAAHETVLLERRALFVLPTREGVYYGAMLAVMLLAGINYANNLAYGLAFLLAAVAVVGVLHTHRNLAGLRIAAGPAAPVFAGQNAVFTVVLHNDGDLARRALDVVAAGHAQRVDVPAGGSAALGLAVPTTVRGYQPAPPLRLRTRFPLGLWHAWSRPLRLPARCLVYPRPEALRPLPDSPGSAGGWEIREGAEGEDFAGLREYRSGDPMQRVAWKKAAAGQGWHTKIFATPAGRLVWLDWYALPDLDTEARLSLLCHWVLQAEQQGYTYGLRLPDQVLAPGTGFAHRDRCLERLALYGLPS